MSKERKHHTPEEKVAILRRHSIERVPVSTWCDEPQLPPTVFHCWREQFFENGGKVYQVLFLQVRHTVPATSTRRTLPLPESYRFLLVKKGGWSV